MNNQELRTILSKLEAHAPGEAAHAERVAIYSVATAHEMGLEKGLLNRFRFASALHDIGKLKVPADLLSSTLALSEAELETLRSHVQLCREAIQETFEVDLTGIESHHERWDGNGYPDGLKGEEIPMVARIIGLAEFFDTMHYGRHFAPRQPESLCLKFVQDQSGIMFDPQVVTAFLVVHPLIQPVGTGAD